MSRRTAGVLSWSIAAGCVGLSVIGLWLQAVTRKVAVPGDFGARQTTLIIGLAFLVFPIIGSAIVTRLPRNAIGWFLIGIGLLTATFVLVDGYGIYALRYRAGTVPHGRVALWVANWNWIPGWGFAALLFLLFPDGRLPSPRWRPLVWATAGWITLVTVAAVVAEGFFPRYPFATNPFGVVDLGPSAPQTIRYVGMLGMIAMGGFAVASLQVRLRRAESEERVQIKGLALAATVILLGLLVWMGLYTAGVPLPSIETGAAFLGVLIPLSIGVAVLRHRLYDVDLVINRAVVFGILATFVTAVYVAVVVWVGAVAGLGEERRTLLSIIASAIVAVAFQPVRMWANHLANRLVYGNRATPYEVLAGFSERVAGNYAAEDILPRMAAILAAGTGAARAEVWLRVGDELRLAGRSPSPDDGEASAQPLPVEHERLPEIPGMQEAIAVRLSEQLLGALAVRMPGREPLSRREERLLADLSTQASLVLRNVRLIAELHASRQRIVAAQDAERRRIERDIHDGAQQQLIALAIQLRLAANVAAKESPALTETLERLRIEANDALENLRDLARGIYPPVLVDQGLVQALTAQARKSTVPVQVQADGVGRYPQEVEAAVYFVTLEALQNVAKYANASKAVVALEQQDGRLRFTVEDDGVGFDAGKTRSGNGLRNMEDRLTALGGRFQIDSAPIGGTRITGEIPVS
jgi:signal transduction histidine kinase